MNFIIKVFIENKIQIIRVYLICTFAGLLYMLQPYVLGRMIDGAVINEYKYVFLFLFVEILIIVFGYIRRYYDTVVFSSIYNNIVLSYIKDSEGSKDISPSIQNARVEMVSDIVIFLENLVPHAINSIVTILISVMYIITVGGSISIYLIPYFLIVILIFTYLRNPLKKANRIKNSNFERQVHKISTKSVSIVFNYFIRQRKIKIRQAVLTAKSYVFVDSVSLILVSFMTVFYILQEDKTPGNILAFYQYAVRLTLSINILPSIINTIHNINDVVSRLTCNTNP